MISFKYRILLVTLFLISGCQANDSDTTPPGKNNYITENVILIIIDGPRYTDTWGADELNIPAQQTLAQQGVLFNNFSNDGITNTLSGHTAITTGYYENVTNNGSELPSAPSIFQHFLSHTNLPPKKSWIITSKSKLLALGDTKNLDWHGSYLPSTSALQRPDKETYEQSLKILKEYQPKLTLIHFKEPDTRGHANDWQGYLQAIQKADSYVKGIWDFLQSNAYYRGKTTVLVTADHGRHSDGINSGFVGHGDTCDGCKHIFLLGLGPDFKKDTVVSRPYGQIDIAPTIATLLNFKYEGEGQAIDELIR